MKLPVPRQYTALPPTASSTSSQGSGGSTTSFLALTAPRSFLNHHGHWNQGSTMVQSWSWQKQWWVQLSPGQHPWGLLLSPFSLASNIDSGPGGLIHLQVSVNVCDLYVFILVWHFLPPWSQWISSHREVCIQMKSFPLNNQRSSQNTHPSHTRHQPYSHLCWQKNWRTPIKEAVPTPELYRAKPQSELSSTSSWYPTSKNNHSQATLKGCSSEKGLLYQLQSNPVSLH